MSYRIGAIALAILMTLSLAPLWCAAFIPTLDGPVHRYIAHALAEWSHASPRMHQIFELNLTPEPNWTIYILLEILMKVFSPQTSDRLLLTAYVLAMPLSFMVFTKLINEKSSLWLSGLLALPLIYNAIFYFGFYNFCLGLPLFVICTALFLRYIRSPSVGSGVVLAVASTAFYFTHIAAWGAFGVAGLALYVWRVLVLPVDGASRLGFAARLALRCALPVLPVVLLVLAFMARNDGGTLAYAPTAATLPHRIKWLATGSVLFGNSLLEAVLIAASFALAAALAVFSIRKRLRTLTLEDGLLLSTIFLVVAALAVPDMLFGGGWTAIRLQIFAFIVPLLWLSVSLKAPFRPLLIPAGLVISSALLLLLELVIVRRMSDEFDHIVAAESHVRSGRTILPLVFDPRGADARGEPVSRSITFLLHSYAQIAMDRDLIPLRIHQTWTKNFPLHYISKTSPYEHLHAVHRLLGSERDNPKLITGLRASIDTYESQTHQTVDYILIVGTMTKRSRTASATIVRNLRGKYAIVAQSNAVPGYELLGSTSDASVRMHAAR